MGDVHFLLACAGPDQTLVAWVNDEAAHARDRVKLIGEMTRMAKPFDPDPNRPDIVVIVLDTVRADHLGLYGYGGATTPNLDRWSADARVWERMVATSSWTLPSHASLFTGLWPRSHGAHGVPDHLAAPLAPNTPTVARALRDAGWQTAGIAANQAFLDRSWGLAQGFSLWMCDQIERDARGTSYPTADRITDLALTYLKRRGDTPTLLFLNYMDAHTPWIPRAGYVARPDRLDRRVLPLSDGWDELKIDLIVDRKLDPATQASWIEAYDAELRFLDAELGRLLDGLRGVGVGPEDHVFILSDHGEYLGEHFLVEHSKDVYDTALHVPYLHRGPGVVPGRASEPVQHTDVARHILAAAGLPPLGSPYLVDGDPMQVAELYYTRRRERDNQRYGGRFDRIRRAFYLDQNTLIRGSDQSEEAYDRGSDPGQVRPVPDAPWVPALRGASEAWLAAHPEAAAVDAPVLNVEALRALGYVE